MARVVFVHGIGAQTSGGSSMTGPWLRAMNDGLALTGAGPVSESEVGFAFYGNLFRPPGEWLSMDVPFYDAADVDAGEEQDLLVAWWRAAAAVDPEVTVPGTDSLVAVPGAVQQGLYQLSRSRFFAGVAERVMIWNLKQVHRYFTEPVLRHQIRHRLYTLLTPDTRIVVAHSLGTVVAYETLCATPDHEVRALVTLGSPLGIPNLVFDRLDPAPVGGIGRWPGSDELVWTNIADRGDVVALVKDLRDRFGPGVRNALVRNESRAHDAVPYLTSELTGQVIAEGLAGGD
ncbi:hypothetical protein [Nocardia amamiensis]|uniref:hypothetical protein n=1 Tax=Nocardia amamiensis TaxID=404578 RepID=UPI0033F3BA16